ncbi:MAG: Yip1 family protein [Calditrichota bacterium]
MANDNTPKDGGQQKPSDDMDELKDLLGKISESDKPRDKAPVEPEKEEIIKKPTGSSDDNENIDSWIEKITEKEDEDTPEEMGVVTRILSVFSQPTALFRYLRDKPDVIVPIVITIIVAIASSFITYDAQIDKQVELYENMNSEIFTEAQKDEAIDQLENSRYGLQRHLAIWGITPLGALAGMLILSVLLWFVGRVLLGGESSFAQTFSMFGYASLFYTLLGSIVKLPTMAMQNTVDIDFSIARLLEKDYGSALYRFLSGFDPFTIWTIILLGIGIAVINRFSIKKGMIVMGVLWLVFLLVFNVGIMGLFNRMGML